jgi:protein O-GlcNAc transferase
MNIRQDATRQVEQAKMFHRQGRLAEAMAIYGDVLAHDPGWFEPHYLLALANYQQGNAAEAYRLASGALELKPRAVEALALLAGALLALNRPAEALAACERILVLLPNDVEAACNRAVILTRLDRIDEAIGQYGEVLARRPDQVTARFNRGTLLTRCARYQDALADFDRVLASVPGHLDALKNRGNVLVQLDRRSEALVSYDRIIAARPDDVDALSNRGSTLRALDRNAEAFASYEKALTVNPRHANTLLNYGNLLSDMGRFELALNLYDRLLELAPNDIDALSARLSALLRLNRHVEALATIDAWLAVKPQDADVLYHRGFVLDEMNRGDEAAACYEEALAVRPDDAKVEFGRCMSALRILYMNELEIAGRRHDYAQRLDALRHDVERAPAAFADAVGARQPFFLAYQGENDRDLQSIYGAMICNVMAARYPPVALPPPAQPEERVRIGIVSGFFRSHSNWKIPIKGWISRLDRRRFRVFGYDTGAQVDAETKMAERLCERFVRNAPSVEAWRQTIIADAPHVLIYPEVGMDTISAQLAAQRLARVQCASWGHPDTSGFATLDYFLSSDLMEPPDAQHHYTERLVRLPNLSIYYEPPLTSDRSSDRRELALGLGLRMSGTRFWCGQSLFKYLPQYDAVFPRIARELGDCQLIFIRHHGAARIAELFLERLEHAFAMHDLSASDYCTLLPRLDFENFSAAMGCCDIILDSIGWSGCNSTLESLPHDLPVVTLAGPLMRGRHTSAILTMMGVTETIAGTIDTYAATAVRLARDRAWYAQIRANMAANKHRVYRDGACIAALEQFLARVAHDPESPAHVDPRGREGG